MSDKFQKYHQSVRFLEGLYNLPREKDYMTDGAGGEIYLQRMKYFLKLLGNPEKSVKNYVHITGTAAKGTVADTIHSCMVRAGYKAGLYTSPFSTTSIEKIKVGKLYISPEEFSELVEEIKPTLDSMASTPSGCPSYFEIFTAIAFLYFKKTKCSWAVVEVGCGGRYDATNVISSPRVAVITNVDYDHTNILGKTLKKIAYEKEGIIKKECAFWTAEQRPHLIKMFKAVCKSKRAKFNWIKKASGDYRSLNIKLVTEICRSLNLSETAIKQGIKKAFMPCRFETVQTKPRVIVDGAHNSIKMRGTAYRIRNIAYRNLSLIFGAVGSKDTDNMLKSIVPLANYILITRYEVKERKCADPRFLLQSAKKYMKKGAKIKIFLDPRLALNDTLNSARPEDTILITGSFFLSGELRTHWYPEENILATRKAK